MKPYYARIILSLALCVASTSADTPIRFSPQINDKQAPIPSSLREDLLEGLLRDVKAHGCGLDGLPADPSAKWKFEIEVREFREYTEYDTTILNRAKSYDPNVRNLLTAKVEFRGAVTLLEQGSDKPIKQKRFYISKAQRPVNLSYDEEWAREEARSRLVEAITGEWRKLLCKQAGRVKKSR